MGIGLRRRGRGERRSGGNDGCMGACSERLKVGNKGGLSFAYFGVGRGEGRIGWVIMHSDPFVLLCGFVNLNSRDCIYEI